MEVTHHINGKAVLFESVGIADNHGHSREHQMEGYTEINGIWIHTHNATGSFTFTGDFEELTDIEPVN